MTHTEYCILLIKIGRYKFDNPSPAILINYYFPVSKKRPYWNQLPPTWQDILCNTIPEETPLVKLLGTKAGVNVCWHRFVDGTNTIVKVKRGTPIDLANLPKPKKKHKRS